MTTEQRRLAAIVSADVAGYSRLLGTNRTTPLAADSTSTPSVAPGVRGNRGQPRWRRPTKHSG
jgi:hypothetical protein